MPGSGGGRGGSDRPSNGFSLHLAANPYLINSELAEPSNTTNPNRPDPDFRQAAQGYWPLWSDLRPDVLGLETKFQRIIARQPAKYFDQAWASGASPVQGGEGARSRASLARPLPKSKEIQLEACFGSPRGRAREYPKHRPK